MKPNNFPLTTNLEGTTELYSQTKDVPQKFTLNSVKEFIKSPDENDYIIHPTSSDLTRTPNDYMGWKTAINTSVNLNHGVEVESVTKQESIISMNDGAIELPLLMEGARFINIGDTVTITGSSIANNNGEWTVIGAGKGLQVEQSADKRMISEEDSTATLIWKERIIVELDWVQAQLEDGTLIWGANNNNTFDSGGIAFARELEPPIEKEHNGYWVAMRPNAEGVYEYVSALKMSQLFWGYWYDYTVKVDNDPNSVIFTVLSDGYGTDQNVGSVKFKLSLIEDVLTLEETEYNLKKTWGELYTELTGLEFSNLYTKSPYYNSDNDWYGMMKGDKMGWYWMYQENSPLFVGYNMLNGQTLLIDISESILNIKNIYYKIGENEGETLSNVLKLITDVYSHSKYGLLIVFNSDGKQSPFTLIWSPNFKSVQYATVLDFYNIEGYEMFTSGNLPSSEYLRYSINNDYVVVSETVRNDIAFGGINFFRKKLDDPNAKSETSAIPYVSHPAIYDIGYYDVWERENSFIVAFRFNVFLWNQAHDSFFVWRNDNETPKIIKSPNIYPNMIEDNKMTGWDAVWNYPNLIALTNKFKKVTF
jgi:hypothetical protein